MRLVTNSIQPNKVEQTEFGWRIKDVPFVKPMELAGGYVPEDSIRETAEAWNGTPPTLNHPRDENGRPISANKKPELQLGRVENARFDGEFVRGDIVVNEADLVRLGGEALDIRGALEDEEPINVSSQYRGESLPAGTYDGEYRSNVERIVEPDSVALLPNKPAQCGLEDGCGIQPRMVANAGVSLTAITDDGETPEGMADMNANQNDGFALTDVTPDDVDSYTDAEWDGSAAVAAMPNPSESDENANSLDATHLLHPTSEEARDEKANWKLPFRESPDSAVNTRALVAAKAAIEGARGGVDAPQEDLEGAAERIEDFLVDAPSDMFGSMEAEDGMSDNTLLEIGRRVVSAVTSSNAPSDSDEPSVNGGAESPAEPDTESMDRETLIEEITANSPLTEAALTERCDDGLQAIHDDVMSANNNDDNGGGEESVTETANDDGVVELTEDELRGMIRDEVKSVTANHKEQSEKQELASEIVANSAEYEDTENVLEDYPTKAALETKKEDVAPDVSAGFPARGATTANTSDVDDYPDMDFGGD